MTTKRRGLGRSLEALLSDIPALRNDTVQIEGDLKQIPINFLQPGKYQPRKDFPLDSLQELADSIRAQGVIQPIVIRTIGKDRYEIIAGERRWRAAQMADLETVPALVRELPDEAAIAIALIENIQRENLNPIEEAVSLQRLISEFSLTHDEVANAVGKSRSAVSNLLRLIALPEGVKTLMEQGLLEMGHARALLSLEQTKQIQYAHLIAEKRLSVRQTEDLARFAKLPEHKQTSVEDPDMHFLQDKLSKQFGFAVQMQRTANGRGKIVIRFKNQKQLDKILEQLRCKSSDLI